MTYNFMIAGVGGQGTVLASKLIAAAAMKKGFDVRTTETIGMAQRGGCVFGHCRIGENIHSPFIPVGKADVILAFEPAEAVRQLHYLKKDGTVIVCDTAVKPITDTGYYEAKTMLEYLKSKPLKLIAIDGQKILQENAKTLNVALLGAAVKSGIFPFDHETLKEVLQEMLPKRFVEMNQKSLELGRTLV